MNVIIPKEAKRLKFAIYVRKSKFTGKGESIENQIQMCKNHIYTHFDDVQEEDIVVYIDKDFTGKNTNRPNFQTMMQDINKKKFNFVVCYRLDRISRSVNDFSNLIHDLDSKEIKFISVKEFFDTSTPMGRAMMNMAAVFAQMERETLAERIKDNMMLLAKTGRWLGGVPPTGFDSEIQEIVLNGKIKKSHHLKVNKDIEIVKLIFQKFLETGSSSYVSKYLSTNNIKTVNDKFYYVKAIKDILQNPVYCKADKDSFDYFNKKGSDVCFTEKDFKKELGLSVYCRHNSVNNHLYDEAKWIVSLGKHRGIIKGKDWVYIQQIFNKNKGVIRNYKTKALLSGLIKCEVRGGNITLKGDSRSKDHSNFWYACRRKEKLGFHMCNSKNLRGPKTDEYVVNYIMNFDESKLKNQLNIKNFSRKVNKFKDKVEDLHFEIVTLKNNQDRYIEHLLKTPPNSSFAKNIQRNVDLLQKRIDRLESQKQIYESQSQLAQNEKEDVEQIIKNLMFFKKNFYTLDFDAKKSLLRLVVTKLTWNGNELIIFMNGEQT